MSNPFENPFSQHLPANVEKEKSKLPATTDTVMQKAIDLVREVSWANDNPDGAPTYVQNRMVFAQATTAVGEVCDIDDADSVRRCISTYFELCKLNSTDPTIPGLANALGQSTRWLKSLKDMGTESFFARKPLLPEVKDAIYQALRVLDMLFAQAVYDGRMAPAAITALGANHFDYVSKVEHKMEITNRGEAPKTIEEIQREFEKLPEIENVDFVEVKE